MQFFSQGCHKGIAFLMLLFHQGRLVLLLGSGNTLHRFSTTRNHATTLGFALKQLPKLHDKPRDQNGHDPSGGGSIVCDVFNGSSVQGRDIVPS